MNKLDINKINGETSRNIKIGELSSDVIKALGLNLKPQDISVWTPRILEHCEKHKKEYSSSSAYYNALQSIPQIINEPDFVGMHSNGNISYIKKIDDISLVGIQILKGSKKNSLLFRTIYPITADKLNKNIALGKYIPLKKRG